MHFIIPKNYKLKSKLLGLMDYQTAILNGVWAGLLGIITNVLLQTFTSKLYVFVGLYVPFLLFSILHASSESLLSVLFYIVKFYKNQKIFLFQKK